MATRNDFVDWVRDALRSMPGRTGSLAQVAEHLWTNHETDINASGKLLFTWQYDMRWAANELRRKGIMTAVKDDVRGRWSLK
jgi:hypothetical protein